MSTRRDDDRIGDFVQIVHVHYCAQIDSRIGVLAVRYRELGTRKRSWIAWHEARRPPPGSWGRFHRERSLRAIRRRSSFGGPFHGVDRRHERRALTQCSGRLGRRDSPPLQAVRSEIKRGIRHMVSRRASRYPIGVSIEQRPKESSAHDRDPAVSANCEQAGIAGHEIWHPRRYRRRLERLSKPLPSRRFPGLKPRAQPDEALPGLSTTRARTVLIDDLSDL